MVAILHSAVTLGLTTQPLVIEVDIASGLPAVQIVGLADKAVTESKERIKTAIKSCGYEFPLGRITINLAPADLAKTGSSLDVPIALGILTHQGKVTAIHQDDLYVGELSLTGEIRPVSGIISLLLWAQKAGKKRVFIPQANAHEVLPAITLEVYPVHNLKQLIDHLNSDQSTAILSPATALDIAAVGIHCDTDFLDIQGQELAKRALTIAAAGSHNIFLIGEPGTGKSMLAKSLGGILPPLSNTEMLEVNAIYSAAGLLNHSLITTPQVRTPHHTASHVALVGGGTQLKPGEITLAHRGVLFLDEFPEFSRISLEALRQPMENGTITLSRASGTVVYPARCMIFAAANPTPHGDFGKDGIEYTDAQTRRYKAKFSGPILDRFDLFLKIYREQGKNSGTQSSQEIRTLVTHAREKQRKRWKEFGIQSNSEITAKHIQMLGIDSQAREILDTAASKLNISLRSYHKIIKVAQTIADLDGCEVIQKPAILEALQYRNTI